MPNEPIQPGQGDLYADVPAHRVYTRAHWAHVWTEQPFLYARAASWTSSPDMPSAELEWRFGVEKQPGAQDFATYTAKDLSDYYVKIEIDQVDGVQNWYGIVTDWTEDRGGVLTEDGSKVPCGRQSIRAVGLVHLWSRAFVTTSIVQSYPAGVEAVFRRGLTFNVRHGYGASGTAAIQGNRSLQPTASGAYAFSNDLDNATTWSTREIVKYLIQFHSPRGAGDYSPFNWRLTSQAVNALPDWDVPVIAADGRTVKEILDQLCDRRRNLSWRVAVGTNDIAWIDVFTFIEVPIVLPGGGVIAPNLNTTTFDFDGAADVYPRLRKAGVHNIAQAVVRGAHKRSVVSLSWLDNAPDSSHPTLIADWLATDEVDYEECTGLSIGPPPPNEKKNPDKVAGYRQKDNLERVFSWFRLPTDWDGMVGNGDGTAAKVLFFPNDPDYGAETVYGPTLRFERKLPRGLVASAPGGSPEREVPPFALVKTETGSGGDPDLYALVEKLAPSRPSEGNWSCSLRMQKDSPGVMLPVSGPPQYFIAKTDFAKSLSVDDEPPLDWKDNLIVTVMLELDAKVESRYPLQLDVDGQNLDVVKRVYVDVGERARLDWVTGNTVIGLINAGELDYPDAGGYYIRDDRTFLADIARFVFEWYGIERRAFDFTIGQLTAKFSVSQLITTIGNAANGTLETVNAVVTGVHFDLVNAVTRVTTDYPEWDFTQV